MNTFKRSDMLYSYSWAADGNDNPKYRNAPDSNLFDRSEGYEVLYSINRFIQIYTVNSVAHGQHAEKLIRTRLPSIIFSRKELFQWLLVNWDRILTVSGL